MGEEGGKNLNNQNTQENIDMSYILFLILILLFLSNSNRLSSYFNLFEKEIERANQIFQALSATAEGLKSAVQTPQDIKQDLGLNL